MTLDKNRRLIKDGAVAIEEDKIVEVGKTAQLKKKCKGEIEIDAAGKIVMPGLVDCHVHLPNSLERGIEDDRTLISWLKDRVFPLTGVIDEGMDRISVLLSCLEMIKSGTTCFAEPYVAGERDVPDSTRVFDITAEAIIQSGMRASLVTEIEESSDFAKYSRVKAPPEKRREKSVETAVEIFRKWHGAKDGKIRVWFGAKPLGFSPPEIYEKIGELARHHNTGVHLHAAEVEEEVTCIEKEYKKTPIEFANDLGITGPNVLFVHAVQLVEKDWKLLAKTKTNVCHCPSSNMKLASGFAKIPEMLEAGVNVALGCDGGICNDSYDMIREMKLAALIHKGRLLSPTVVAAETAIEMATVNGAKALMWEKEIGSLEKGKKADVVLIDAKSPHMVPHRNLPSNLVYSGMGSDVSTVIIDGKIVMKNRVVKTIDEADVIDKAIELAEEMDIKANVKIHPRWHEI